MPGRAAAAGRGAPAVQEVHLNISSNQLTDRVVPDLLNIVLASEHIRSVHAEEVQMSQPALKLLRVLTEHYHGQRLSSVEVRRGRGGGGWQALK